MLDIADIDWGVSGGTNMPVGLVVGVVTALVLVALGRAVFPQMIPIDAPPSPNHLTHIRLD